MIRIDRMTVDDVVEVSRVERLCFSNPWPASAYRRELQNLEHNYYLVLRDEGAAVGQPLAGATGSEIPVEMNRSDGVGSHRVMPRRTLLPLGLARRLEGVGAVRLLPPIVGFAGMWVMYDEAHLTTIGVVPSHRGRRLGEFLLVTMFDEALRRRAEWLTLEVRASNAGAQKLYHKYGMAARGTRRRYYSDNNEDAVIMWSRSLKDETYRQELELLRQELFDRVGHEIDSLSLRLAAGD